MEKEEIILTFAVETQDAENKINELKKNIEGVKNSQDDLNQKFAEGTVTLEDYNKETAKNNNALRANEKAVQSLTDAITDETESINSLRKQNSELTKERNALNLKTKEGQTRLEQINNAINANNIKIKLNSTELEKNKINIGNYSSALQGLGGNLQNIIPGLSGMQGGLSGITAGANAFSASPFGATLAAITIALNLGSQYLSKFTAALDFLENITTQVSAGFSAFVSNFDMFLSLNWGGLADKIGGAANEAQRLLDFQRQLDEQNIVNQINQAKNQEILARLNVLSRDRTKTEKERIKAIEDAIAIEKKQNTEQINYLEGRLRTAYDQLILSKKDQLLATDELIKKERQQADARIAQESQFGTMTSERRKQIIAERDANIERIRTGETLNAQLNATTDITEKLFLINKSGLFDEEKELQPVIEAYKAYTAEKAASAALEEKARALTDKLLERQTELATKAAENAAKQKEIDDQRIERETQIARLTEKNTIEFLEKKSLVIQTEKELEKEKADYLLNLQDKLSKGIEERIKAEGRVKAQALSAEKARQAQLEILRDQALATADAIFGETKKGQTALTLISTYLAAQKAYESQFVPFADFSSPVRGTVAAALAVAQGLARVAAINGIGFSGGGYTGDGGKYEPAGIVHKGEVVFSQRDVAMLGGANRVNSMRPTFKGYADGGIVTSAATNPINQQFSVANAFRNMPPIYASWKEATEIQTRVRFKESLTTV